MLFVKLTTKADLENSRSTETLIPISSIGSVEYHISEKNVEYLYIKMLGNLYPYYVENANFNKFTESIINISSVEDKHTL